MSIVVNYYIDISRYRIVSILEIAQATVTFPSLNFANIFVHSQFPNKFLQNHRDLIQKLARVHLLSSAINSFILRNNQTIDVVFQFSDFQI